MEYNYMSEFVDGVGIATHRDKETGNLQWGLIDKNSNPVSEFKYNYIEAWGEGYYKCEIGSRKNILRKDGTEVLKEWFNDVFKVKKGLFVIGNTVRKTKDHPTQYPRGLASVNGDILFPLIFRNLRWNDDVVLDYLIGEVDDKPYIITQYGSIIDPTGDHLPRLSEEKDNFQWDGPKDTVCDGCIFTDGINSKGEGCRKLQKEEFRNRVIKGQCEHYKVNEQSLSFQEERDKYKEEKAIDKASKETDVYAMKLVKDFIKDKLDGDVMKLTSFDFNELRDDEKYGNCGGYAFSPDKTNIMKAILTLTFKEAWPEISYDGFDHYDYQAEQVNTYLMILGFPLGENFKGLRKFRPSADILDRAWAFYHLCHTIGNYMVWPGGITICRDRLPRSQRYIDSYLKAIHDTLISTKVLSSELHQAVNRKKKVFAPYRTDVGFVDMCRKMYLGDYLDYMGKPMALFDGVWSDQKDLKPALYFKALEQYLDFCEEKIVKRSKRIAKRLMEVLDMVSSVAEPEEVLTIQLPKEFESLESMPDDPEGALSYVKDTSGATCFIQSYPIQVNQTMPMNDINPIVDGIHANLGDRQGLIEVVNGSTRYNKNFVYSIVKSARIPSGMNYILTMHIVKGEIALCLKGQFEERGSTGIRDTTVYEYAIREKLIKGINEGWMKDPYDEKFDRGILMNLSEKREYDYSFPNHPLSEMRRLIDYIIDNN